MILRANWTKAAAAVCALAILAACERPFEIPAVSGNTYAHHNDLATIYPNQTFVNISYEYELRAEQEIDIPGLRKGPSWLYVERASQEPSRFLLLHVVTSEPADGIPAGQIERFGKIDFTAIPACVDLSQPLDPTLQPFVDLVKAQDYSLSRDLYVYRFYPRTLEGDGKRIDLIYLQDIERDGVRCADFGPDIANPEGDAASDLAANHQARAFSSFEIIN